MGMFPGIDKQSMIKAQEGKAVSAISFSFKEGDVVRLKSGGPDMCVHICYPSTSFCVWFGDHPYHQSFMSQFNNDCLELATAWIERQRETLTKK